MHVYYKIILILFITTNIFAFISMIYRFKPRNSSRIYSIIIAHRGLHLFYPENSLGAYIAAKDANLAIEIDVRRTKEGKLVCFHDRYTKRLLNIPGKLEIFNFDTIKKYNLLDSNYKVPTLVEALSVIEGKVDVLIEVKGHMDDEYLESLLNIQNNYKREMFFHTKDLKTYYKLKKVFPKTFDGQKRVYFVSNLFRKRFNFVKGRDYNSQIKKYNELASNVDIQLPSIEDISNIIVKKIEEAVDKKEVLAAIGSVVNRYESRVKLNDKTHWVYNSIWLHRGIVSNLSCENSKDCFLECIKFANENNISLTVEFDVVLHKGEIRCYHSDKISSVLGQEKSCAQKAKFDECLTLKEILLLFKDNKNINLAIDIKDYHIRSRVMEDLIIRDIKETGYDGNFILMSFNPLALKYLKIVEPNWLRAQIGHSLKGLRKIPIFRFPPILNGVLGILFDMSCADCTVFDNSKWIYYLIAYHKNIRGKPVLIYAPKTYLEQESFIGRESVANFIVENIADNKAWPKEYIDGFKLTKKE